MSRTEESIARAQELADEVSGQPHNVEAALPELADLLEGTDDTEVLIAVILALAEAWDERAVPLLLPLVDHPDALVREAATLALPNGVTSAAVRDLVVPVLVARAYDDADEVRNWACFGLRQLGADGPDVRQALTDNLANPDLDTRSEALVALARLGDPAALPATMAWLGADPDDVAVLELQAAAELADPALLPVLERLSQAWAGDEDEHVEMLAFALARCRPEAADSAAALEQLLVSGVNSAVEEGRGIRLEGSYPRTAAHILRPEGGEPESYLVWDDEEPESFDLEQQVASFVITIEN
jgi:HEAT repeat protein